MSVPARLVAAVLALALPFVAPAPVAAQVLDGAPGLALRHGFPEAGSSVRVLVEGLQPGALVVVQLGDPGLAPPSMLTDLAGAWGPPELTDERGATWLVPADGLGLLDVLVQLDDPLDVGRFARLTFEDTQDGRAAQVQLLVQAPTVLVATATGLERVDLRDGTLMQPPVPAAGGLADAALSKDGRLLSILREDGQLEWRSAAEWDGPVLAREFFDASGDDLARAKDLGAVFVVESPDGSPFAPAGRLAFLGGNVLPLSPMGQEVVGRRWTLHPDGTTAFVAEDDLLVREVDLLSQQAWRPFPVGAPGDDAIADMVVQGDRLLVATRRASGLSGSLSVLDLVTGQLDTQLLAVDPRRLVVVDEHNVLVVPANGAPVLERVEDGLVASATRSSVDVLDAAPVEGGALLLGRAADGSHPLLRWSSRGLLPTGLVAPSAGRLHGAGHAVAVLVGDNGQVWRVALDRGAIEPVAGLRALAETDGIVLP